MHIIFIAIRSTLQTSQTWAAARGPGRLVCGPLVSINSHPLKQISLQSETATFSYKPPTHAFAPTFYFMLRLYSGWNMQNGIGNRESLVRRFVSHAVIFGMWHAERGMHSPIPHGENFHEIRMHYTPYMMLSIVQFVSFIHTPIIHTHYGLPPDFRVAP